MGGVSSNTYHISEPVTKIPCELYGAGTVSVRFWNECSGTINTASFWDHALGRLSALLRGSLIDGINDHSCSEYIRLFKQALIHSRLSLLDKTKSVVMDAVQTVRFFVYCTDALARTPAYRTKP